VLHFYDRDGKIALYSSREKHPKVVEEGIRYCRSAETVVIRLRCADFVRGNAKTSPSGWEPIAEAAKLQQNNPKAFAEAVQRALSRNWREEGQARLASRKQRKPMLPS
jgi:hypothetical protein